MAGPTTRGKKRKLSANLSELSRHFGGPGRVAIYAAIAVTVFVTVNVLFYSSFFTHSKGLHDAISTFQYWTKTGEAEHAKPFYKYVQWLVMEEAGLLVLGIAGALLALFRGRSRFALFSSLWAFGILTAYSILPYKTPWLVVNFIVPLAIVSGYALSTFFELAKDRTEKIIVAIVAALVFGLATVQMVRLNFYHYDDEAYPYVYVHTQREFLDLINEINRVAKASGTGEQTSIAVMTPEYWPLPWYLNGYQHVGYLGKVTPTSDAIVIAADTEELVIASTIGNNYRRVGSYRLRPGITLVLYVRKDLPV
jgi:uncharacterized protein (TIGR03663 family)